MSLSLGGHADVRAPEVEGLSAIEHTRKLLDDALACLVSGDDDRLVLGYEHASECADDIGRALWFLRRMAKEQAPPAAAS
ncbi:MAG TPA: hypothetical protein VFX49_12500 [Chloroflexota bacterium]|nr:hypothetical protein [Chloroflexota bacterium]